MRVELLPIDKVKVNGRHRKDLGDIESLADSIADVGLLHPLVIDSGRNLIAGERRLAAAKNLGWQTIPAYVAANLDDAILRLHAERDENTCRLDFTPEEYVAVGLTIENLERPKAEDRRNRSRKRGLSFLCPTCGESFDQTVWHCKCGHHWTSDRTVCANCGVPRSGNFPERGRVREKVAASLGVSDKTYEKAKAVVSRGDRALIDEMNRTRKVDGAFRKLQTKERQAARPKHEAPVEGFIHGDFRQVGSAVKDSSVSLIFTDPPYDRKSLPMFSDLGAFANRVLIDGGSLITFGGQYVLDTIVEQLKGAGLRYFWALCCLHSGPAAQMREYGIKVKWKPLLWFVKGQFRADRERWIEDVILSNHEKNHHDWQQAEIDARHCIESLTETGDLVVDPFCGGGTTAIVAAKMKRLYWTCDTDPEALAVAKGRMNDAKV